MADDFWVCIQTTGTRTESLAKTEASVRASDIGDAYELAVHPPGLTIRQFFCEILQLAAEQPAALVLRLEDDVRVNRHILTNLRTWPALQEPDFGVGWAFVPRGMAEDQDRLAPGAATGTPFRSVPETHMAQALVLKQALLPEILGVCLASVHAYRRSVDLLISGAVESLGRHVYLHLPTLADHDITEPSVIGNRLSAYHHSADGTFDPEWRRPKS